MRLYGRSQFSAADIALVTSEPFVHQDFQETLLHIYEEVSRTLAVPARSVMVTGSAFTGQSYRENRPFSPGVSDLDVAVVDRDLFRELLLCASRATKYFRDQTAFQPTSRYRTGAETFKNFRNYAFNRGIVRPDLMPECNAKNQIDDLCQKLTNAHIQTFSKISISVYGDEEYFIAKSNNQGST